MAYYITAKRALSLMYMTHHIMPLLHWHHHPYPQPPLKKTIISLNIFINELKVGISGLLLCMSEKKENTMTFTNNGLCDAQQSVKFPNTV